MESETNESPTTSKRILQLWSDGDTCLLLDLYANYLPEIGPLKKFKSKKDMWSKISTEIPDKSAKQCEERYKTVLRRKNLRKIIEFEAELTKICKLDDSIEPEVQMSSQQILKKEKINKVSKGSDKKRSVHQILEEIAAKREEAREKRHKEKMEAIEKTQSLLQTILQEKNLI
ncbi:uncharacterized protein LOC111688225 [Lucilia cuprina]|uniref:uncharacterized protein LOC111688225 n=1 Tax=Lucilia cuprina TaxID=7375 RepID=UPI001F06D28F|nr:uncharacterized protein LOC111688225 [Lucilia cuprina]